MLSVLILGLVLTSFPIDSTKYIPSDSSASSNDSLSFQDISQPVKGSDSIPVFKLKGMTVTATRTPLSLMVAPASVSIISFDSLGVATGPLEAFEQTAGGNVGITGGLGSVASFSIRGSSSEQVLFLLNGIPLNSSLSGGFDLNKINLDIKQIEIVKGASSALYGANAAAGVVNIITPEGAGEKPYSKVTYSYGKHKQQKMSATLSRQLSSFLDIYLSADWENTDGERPNSDYGGSNYFMNATVNPFESIKFKIDYKSYQSMSGSPGSLLYDATLHDRMSDDQQDFYASIFYSDFIMLKFGQSMIDNIFYSYNLNSITRNFARQNNADLQFNYSFREKFNSVIGFSFQQVNSESDNSGNHKIGQYSAFVTQDYMPLAPWLVAASLRLDKSTSYEQQISPSVSTSWQFSKGLSLYTNYGRAYRAPTINELYWSDPYSSGNPELLPEKTEHFEFGGRLEGGKYLASLAAYQKSTKDMIKWFSDSISFLWTDDNLAKVDVSGLELTAGFSALKYLSLRINYDLCLAKVITDSSRELNYTPANSANITFSIQNYPLAENLSFSWQFNALYKDRQLVNHPNEWGPGSELPRYLLSGQTLSFKVRDAVLFYKVDNLFNAEYQVRQGYPMPRRSYAFGISMELWD